MMQISKGLWEGMIHSNFGETPDSNHPLMVKYRAWHQKYEPKERWSTFYIAGILFAEPFVEGLKRTGKNLTPDNFVKAMEAMKDWQGIGCPSPLPPPTTRAASTYSSARCRRTATSKADGLDADHLLIGDARTRKRKKFQIPKSKFQTNFKIANFTNIDSRFWNLNFGNCLGFGAWIWISSAGSFGRGRATKRAKNT